jgi:hypothetical protein
MLNRNSQKVHVGARLARNQSPTSRASKSMANILASHTNKKVTEELYKDMK